MFNVYVLDETFISGYTFEFINFLCFNSVLCGIFVIISKNPVISVLFLIGLFLNITGYLFMLGINFIGLSYLLVYVGAISILFLFILMLINVRISELLTENNNSIPLAIIIGICFNYPLYQMLPYNMVSLNITNILYYLIYNNSDSYINKILGFSVYNNDIMFVTSNSWDGNILKTSDISSIGNIMYTSYSIWLLITSIILLLAMVGTICLVISRKN